MPATMRPDESFQPSNSVDLLQNRARKIADQSLQSTRRMVVMVDEPFDHRLLFTLLPQSKEVGLQSLITLDEQGEKLDVLDEAHNEIREDMKQSEKALSEMEMCCGVFVIPWRRPAFTSKNLKECKNKKDKVVSDQPQRVAKDKDVYDEFLPRITNDEGEEEMDGNLSHVHSTVGNLKSMAASINAEVKAHNRQLDKLQQKAENNDQHVQAAVQRTAQLQQK